MFLSFGQFLERFLDAQVFFLKGLDDDAVIDGPFHEVGADVDVAFGFEDPVVVLDALHLAHLRNAEQLALVDLILELHDNNVVGCVCLFEVFDLVIGNHHTFINNDGALADGFHFLHDMGG